MNQLFSSFVRTPGALLLALVLVLAIGWAHQAYVSLDEADAALNDGHRTIVVSRTETPSTAGELHATLVNGSLSRGVYEAEVLSDEDCAPDADGVSHCLNQLALGDTRITVRYHHRMSEIPCLRPGKTVTIIREISEVSHLPREGAVRRHPGLQSQMSEE